MTCGCGQTYVLNEPVDGTTDARKRIKDTSFRSFITFMLITLLVFTAVFCLLFFTSKRTKHNSEILNASATDNSQATLTTTLTTSQEMLITTNEGPSDERENTTVFLGTTQSVSINTCKTADCQLQGVDILGRMDHSTDPCDDFYQFSCGRARGIDGVLYPEPSEALYKSELVTDKHLRIFRDFFESCVRFHKESDYPKRRDQVLNSRINDSSLTTLLAFLILRQSTPLFEVRAGFISEAEGYGLQILPPGDYYDTTVLTDWSLEGHIARHCFYAINKFSFKKSVNLTTLHEEHETCRNNTFSRKLRELSWLAAAKERKLYENVDLEFLLNKIQLPSVDVHQALLNETFSKMDVRSLKEKYGLIDWKAFFSQLITDFDENSPIYLYLEDEYFEKVMKDLSARLRENEAKVLNTIQLYYQLQIYEYFMAHNMEIVTFCMKQTMELMSQTAAVLRSKFFDITSAVERFKYAFDELKNKFSLVIDNSNLDEQTKDDFKEDVKSLTFEFNKEHLYALENKHEVSLTDDYVDNVYLLLEEKRRTRMDTEAVSWIHENSHFPKVIYNSQTIVIGNEFIYKYLQLTKGPSYVSETFLNFHLSRAIALYLDKSEARLSSPFYDYFKRSLNAALETDDGKRKWRGHEIRFKQDHDEHWRKKVRISMSNRMADNLAINIAKRVVFPLNVTTEKLPWISDDYDPEKQFFILIAQEYCDSPSLPELIQNFYDMPNLPGMIRANAMLANSDQFSVAFSCGEGSRMNPRRKTNFETFVPKIDTSRFDVNK